MARQRELAEYLANVPLFSPCSKKDLALVAKKAVCVLVDAGSEFFVIIDGQCEVSRHGQPVAPLGPGAFFGDLALLDRAPRNATITALTDMELLVLGQRDFHALIDEVPGFAHKLLAGLAHRLRENDAKSVQ